MSVEERVRKRVRRALAEGPKHGTMTRTSVKLQETGPGASWVEAREIAPERIERLARAMMDKGVEPARAQGVAGLIAEDARRYVDTFKSWLDERDAEAADAIGEVGCLASALREALGDLGDRAARFVQQSMSEDQFARRFLAERQTAIDFCLALEMAARKVQRPAHRPTNGAARDLMRGVIHTWCSVVGGMPSPPNKREDFDERPNALHNIVRDMVTDASAGHELAGHMVGQISVSAFEAAHKEVRSLFERTDAASEAKTRD